MRPLIEQYPDEFREWVANLTRLHLWQQSGYDLNQEPLTFADWTALAMIARYYKVQDLQAIAAAPRIA